MKNKKRSKIIKLLITIILLGIIVFFVSKRWNAWFDNPTEPPYTSSGVPARIQLTLGNDGQFSRIVSWQCGDTLAASQLLIVKSATTDTTAIAAEGKMFHTQGGVTVLYHVRLNHLTAGEYSYCVSTGGNRSTWYNFSVNADDNFSFIYVGDIQDSIGGTVRNGFLSISRKEKDAAFWILGGDVIERPQDRYWNEYYSSMDSIRQTTPIIACAGNHEYHKGVVSKLEERFIYNFPYFIDSQKDGNAVFDTHYGKVAIIILDSNRDTWTLLSQRNWLKQALQRAKNAQWKIVVLHHPIYSVRGKFRHFFIRHLFDPLIREYGVDFVLQGHEHCYARMTTKDKNHSFTTPVYVISQFSPKDYTVDLIKNYDRYGNGMRFYQVFDVSGDTLSFKTYTENGDLYDQIRIVKTDGKPQVVDLATDIPVHFDPNSPRLQK